MSYKGYVFNCDPLTADDIKFHGSFADLFVNNLKKNSNEIWSIFQVYK